MAGHRRTETLTFLAASRQSWGSPMVGLHCDPHPAVGPWHLQELEPAEMEECHSSPAAAAVGAAIVGAED